MGVDTGKGYIPEIGESALVWPTPMNAGLEEHFDDDDGASVTYHHHPGVGSRRMYVHLQDGSDARNGERPDLAKKTPQAALDVLANEGGDLFIQGDGRRTRAESPHLDTGSDPAMVIDANRLIRIFMGMSDVEGHGGDATAGSSACWIRANVSSEEYTGMGAGVIQVAKAAQLEIHGGLLENIAGDENADGIAIRQSGSVFLVKTAVINSAGKAFHWTTSGTDSSQMIDCIATGCGWGLLGESNIHDPNNTAAPNNLIVLGGQLERSLYNNLAFIVDTGEGGGRGLILVGLKLQHSNAVPFASSYADRASALFRGLSSALLLALYNEQDDDSTFDSPFWRLRECRGGDPTDQADWNSSIIRIGGEDTYGPDFTGNGWSSGVAAHIDADATIRYREWGVHRPGTGFASKFSSTHPMFRFRSNTAANLIVADELGNTSSRPPAAGIFVDDGIGNDFTYIGGSDGQTNVKVGLVLTPSTITSDQTAYNPSGFDGTTELLRLATNASRKINSLVGFYGGRRLVIANVGANPLVLTANYVSPGGGAPFLVGSDYTVAAGDSVHLFYDDVSQGWRILGHA